MKERLKATWPNFWIRLNNEDLAQRDGRCPISLPEYINVGEKPSPGCCWLVTHAARSYPVNTRAVRRRSHNSLFEDDIEEVNAHWRGGGQLAGEGERDPHDLASLRVTCQFCDLGTAAGKGYSRWSEHRPYAAAVYASAAELRVLVCGLLPYTSGDQIKSPIKTSPQENPTCAHIVREAMYIFLGSSRLPGPFQVHEFMKNSSKSVFTKQETGGEEILKGKDQTGGRGERGK